MAYYKSHVDTEFDGIGELEIWWWWLVNICLRTN